MNISDPWPTPIGIIGAGAVGLALAHAFAVAGLPLVGVGARNPDQVIADYTAWLAIAPAQPPIPVRSPQAIAAVARLVVLAVPDGALPTLAADLAWQPDQWVVHCAGSQPAASIAAAVAPAQAGAFHPLAAFPRPTPGLPPPPDPFAGCVIALDGPEPVVAGLRALALRLGSVPLLVPPAARAAYHLAASLASNALVALVAEAVDIWHSAGLAADLALPALLPLIASTEANLARVGLPTALTGPIARGDAATVARHLAALTADPTLAEIAAVYRLLGRRALALARAQGRANPAALDAIAALLVSN